MNGDDFTIERVRVLSGCTSPETAHLVHDYPYGSLRCQRRTWIHTAENGQHKSMQRFMYQTTNPKRSSTFWNKPHASAYSMFTVMYLDQNDHVDHRSLGLGDRPARIVRMQLMGIDEQLTGHDRARWDFLYASSRRYAKQWDEWEETLNALAEHIRTTGTDPKIVNGEFWETPTGNRFLGYDVAAYIVSARKLAAGQPIVDNSTH
ncbi:hypothetical protein [Amycolatopsis sp. WGS_07]|uniref:hypothetical protein n=1 Tax=Amycolatopsis sp. WGS_07 TaxID=3076764 RepID=UPI003872E480